ncbi:hypothetical protein KC19_10G033100 [Ceratodon purpureus]|uniref:Protein kinase domain-containing protein n=1 Tax=Ceratodon purpureus TaxID=3225 RepID=A0A8T0GHJ8_CERPU|nr:hypothetical protein KC19_10G033100 [Ceratodon purpureus]
MMESNLHHPIAVLGRVCSTVAARSGKPTYLDQTLCSRLADCLKFTAQMLTEVQQTVDSIEQKYPAMFRELYIIACRAHILVERCCSEEWLRILFLQACTSHKEEALDVIDDLEWCMAEIWKISCLPRLPSQALLKFKELLKECEDLDRSLLLKQLERHVLVPLAKQELQLTKYLLERIKVQVVASTPRAIEVSLDYRKFSHSDRTNYGFTGSVLVGQGSSAKVYKTTFLETQCARKVQTAATEDQLQELAKQARKLATLSHPHVIKLLGFYEYKRTDEGVFEGHWLMECMDGDLLDNIRRCLYQYPIAVDILLQIAKGVRYLHENDVAHRDLKCGNILVRQSPVSSKVPNSANKEYLEIKVTDFDMSKFFASNSSDLQVQSKSNVGSTPWRAPEAFTKSGKSWVNPKSADSYSFAMTCFELLSGEDPFTAMPGISWTKAHEALIAGRRPPLPKDCPELLRDLILECWRTNPMQRPAFPEICRRLQDVRTFLLTGSLTQRKRQRGTPFLHHNAKRIVSMFKNMRLQPGFTRKQIRMPSLAVPVTEAPLTHMEIIQNVQQIPEVDLLHSRDHRTPKTAKVVVGLDLGTTHTGVAYAMVSNPDEIFTISNWPLVAEEAYHCKTLSAIYKSSPHGEVFWGYPARREYGKNVRGNDRSPGSGLYSGELKQSLASNDFDPVDHQPVEDFLRELGKFVLGYLQHEYPLELLEIELLRWCITVPSNWNSDLKQKLGACMVNAGLVRGQVEDENVSSNFDMFLESDAAVCYCNGYFAHVNLKKGDRFCVLDVGSGNLQCVFEDWDVPGQRNHDDTKQIYGVKPSFVESHVQENFLNYILAKKNGCSLSTYVQLLRDDPSVWLSLLEELDSLKVDLNHSVKIPSKIMMHHESVDSCNCLSSPTATRDHHDTQCALNDTQLSDELLLSPSDMKFIFMPLVDGVVSFLQEHLQSEPNVKRLFVVGGYVKHVYFMEEIRKSFPNLRIDMPKNPGSAICKGAVALGLQLYFEFQAGLVADASSKSEGGGQGSDHNDKKSNGDNHRGGQPESSKKANLNLRSYPRAGGTSDTKGSQQIIGGDQIDIDSPREKILVTLDFGTSQMGFGYGFESQPGEIAVCKDEQRRTSELYYKIYHDTLQLHSCGERVKDDIVNDYQQPDNPENSALVLGAYVSKPKLHLVVDNADPEVELHLPEGLIVDDVISDCLREYGHFILEQLQEKFGNDFKLHHIQWCLLVPSFWGENTKRRMEACMINAGLLRGPISVNGSPHPLVTVLKAEAASMACIEHLSPHKGTRFLVASIGGGTLDMVIQEWIGDLGMYDMKEVSSSAGGLYGSSCLDLNFLALLSMKMGAWVSEYFDHFPSVMIDMMSQWENIKVNFSDDCELKIYTLHLPIQLQNAWWSFECRLSSRKVGTSYASLELTNDDIKMVFEPVVQTVLERIGAHLAISNYVDVLVVVGGFAKSPYLHRQILCRFDDQRLLSLADTESVVLKGALLFAQHPKGIRSRIARKTYGLGLNTDFNAGVCGAGENANEMERFRIDVEKGCCLGVDDYVESHHQPISLGQESMKFTMYSSVESYPRFTGEQSVAKEWEFVVDISDAGKLEEKPKIRIRLYYGRSIVEVVAEAMNFGSGNQLPVTFAIGAHNVKKPLEANVAKKTYGVGSCKSFEMWDLPEYQIIGVEQEDTLVANQSFLISGDPESDAFHWEWRETEHPQSDSVAAAGEMSVPNGEGPQLRFVRRKRTRWVHS